MSIRRNVHIVASVISCLTISDNCSADDFQPMFNGRDLSGWVLTNTPAETWTCQNGLLVCSGKPIGEIRTEQMYQNFIMELEWRHMVPRGNAGVFVWADDITSRGVPFHRGIEVQVLENAYGNTRSHTTHGDIFPIHGATMTPKNGRGGSRAFPTEERSRPSPEWNHYRIECRDGKISLAVNGKVVTRGEDCVPRKGYICLESEGGIVHYRNVRIQKLPDSPISADQTAIPNRGYRSIYNGLNLGNWEADGHSEQWKSSDWVLAFNGGDADSSTLTSTEVMDHISAVVDVRLKSAASTALVDMGSVKVDLSEPRFAEYLEKQGRWNRLETVQGETGITVLVNNNPVLVSGTKFASGSVALRATGPVDFSNLYIRSVTP